MTNEQELIQKALDVLERLDSWLNVRHYGGLMPSEKLLCEAMRSALEHPTDDFCAENEMLREQNTMLNAKLVEMEAGIRELVAAGAETMGAGGVSEPVAYSIGRTLHWHPGRGIDNAQLYAAPPQREPAKDEQSAKQLLVEALRDAQWHDKRIHPVGDDTYQNWRVVVYLPVPLSESDKSPEAALSRAISAPKEQA